MRRLLLAAGCAVAALVAAAPATPAPNGGPRLVEAGGAKFPERHYVLTLPARRSLSAGQVRVTENGDRVSGLSILPATSSGGREFGVVLVIDTSRSMRGKAIRDAFEAARAFAAERNPNQQLALVTFNSRASVLLPFTADAAAIGQALSTPPPLALGTHVYDGVHRAVELVRQARIKAPSVVVLSDGSDTGSRRSRAEVAREARTAGIRIFSVSIRSSAFNPEPLRALAASASGSYSEAGSSADLSRIYTLLGTQLANQYLVRYRSLAGPGERVRVRVRVAGVQRRATSGYVTPALPAPTGEAFHPTLASRIWQSPFTLLVAGLGAAALMALGLMLVLRRRPSGLRRRLGQFVSVQSADGAPRDGRLTNRVLTGAERSLESTRLWTRIKDALLLADIRMPAVHVVAWTAAGTLLLSWFLAVAIVMPLALLGLVVPLAVRAFVLRRIRRKRALFADQLPDNLQILSSALRAGHSFVGALSVVVDDASEPSRREFRRVVADEQLGVSLEDALERVVQRMDNRDLKQVSLVAALQRQTGGNMAEVLDRVAETLRERAELRALVKTLTAQGRMSRWVVSLLPVVLLLVISALNPGYVKPLFSDSGGQIALGLAAAMVVAGSLVIKRIVDIKL